MYNKKMIVIKAREAKNLLEKVTGLIGKEKPISLLIKTHFGIHTFGLKFPIDVLILNNKNQVVVMKKNIKPNRIFLWNPTYNKVIELQEGTINKKKIRVKSEVHLLL